MAWSDVLKPGLGWLSERRLPRVQGTLRTPGLEEPVEVIRDRWGVPHIYARSSHDVMLAQGMVHAQDRLWQMEFYRRLVAGRLSEVMGRATVRYDRWLRTLGLRRAAEREVEMLGPEARAAMEAYASGVSACIASEPLPVEFTILAYRPARWTVADSLSWHKMMAWMLSANWEAELLRSHFIDRLGSDLETELEPPWLARWPTIAPHGLERAAAGAERERVGAGLARQGIGSNSWVLSGVRTASGAPLLANDMHLMLQAPSIWYENHLVVQGSASAARPTGTWSPAAGTGDSLNVTGVSLPGAPGVVAGHNVHVAWGFTDAFADVQDLYREHLQRTADGRVFYEYRGAWLEAEVRRETIGVRWSRPVEETVVCTRHGPIINALASGLDGDDPLALRWTSLEPSPTAAAVFAVNRARSCRELREALREWAEPVLNVVYADTAGNIGYSLPGKVPLRHRGRGRLPAPGWTGEYEWTGYIPLDDLPHLYNPPQGYVVTANNRIVGEGYPYFLSADYAIGDRAQRIVELIEARARVDVAYVQRMQYDLVSPSARVIAGYLGRLRVDDEDLAAVVEMMRRWDGRLGPESPEATVFEGWMRRMVYLLLSGPLGEWTVHYAGKGTTPLLQEFTVFGVWAWQWLEVTLAEPRSHWFDLGHGETRDDDMRRALRETVDWLHAELGPGPEDWAWSRLHRLTFTHPLGRVQALASTFNRGPYPIGGDETTVWAGATAPWDLSSSQVMGPANRFIADLGDLDGALGMVAPGQSGRPGSPHYDDQVEPWLRGGYHRMLYARAEVEREAEATLALVPGVP